MSTRARPLPGARRPSWRWYVAVARLRAANGVTRIDRRALSRLFAALAVIQALYLLRLLIGGA